MSDKYKSEEWETAHHKAQHHKTEQHEVEKAAVKTADEVHAEVMDCINASQAGAVLERIEALKLKFPELQGAMQIPPPPPEPEVELSGTKRKK